MRRRVAVDEIFALFNNVAFLHRQMLGFGNQIFYRLHIGLFRMNDDPTLVFIVAAKLHTPSNFGNNRVVFGATGFEQLGNARQTAGNIA